MLVDGAAVDAAPPELEWQLRWLRRASPVLAALLLLACCAPTFLRAPPALAPSPLAGTWSIPPQGADVGPGADDPALRWRTVAAGRRSLAAVHQDDTMEPLGVGLEPALREIRLREYTPIPGRGAEVGRLTYVLSGDRLELTGTLRGRAVTFHAERVTRPPPLLTRGFHWVSEEPFNR